ncbi:MAG: FmdE family protein [Thermoleophilia bacterium]
MTEHPQIDELAAFHGHMCPGLAIGYRATLAGLERLEATAARDEEIVAIVENDSCSVDAVQFLSGATFGKGNFFFRDWGKQVFTFASRETGKAVRVSLQAGSLHGNQTEDEVAVRARLADGTATPEDREAAARWRREKIDYILDAPIESLFDIREVEIEIPPPASIQSSRECDRCGEPVMATRVINREGKALCMECAQAD